MKLSGKQLTTAVLIGLMGISAGGVVMAKPPIVQSAAGGQQDQQPDIIGIANLANQNQKDIKALEQKVGDENSGLTQAVNANKKAIGDGNGGLKKDVADNKAGVADNKKLLVGEDGNGGLKKDVADNKAGVADNKKLLVGEDGNGGLKKDVNDIKNNYVSKSEIAEAKKKLEKAVSDSAGVLADAKKATDAVTALTQTDAWKEADQISKKLDDTKVAIGDENSGLTKDVKDLTSKVGDENNGLTKDVKDLTSKVGDENNGLTKDVKDLTSKVGDENSGLTKDVKALQDAVGDDSKGLTKDVNANKKAIGDANSGLTKAVNANKADLAKKADKSELEDYVRKSDLKIGNNAKDIQKVGARAAALAGLHPLEFDPSTKLSFAVSSGSYDGENSVAFGAFYRPTKNVMLSAASTMGSKNAYTFGMSFKFGESSATTTTNTPDVQELYRVVGQLQYQVAAQQQEIQQLRQAAQKTK